jgi:hypothetical protein
MAREEPTYEQALTTELLRLNAILSGITTGLIAGLIIFVATIWLVIKGGPVVGPHLALLGQFFIGYQVTVAGSLIGALYGFACGFVAGYAVARLYNALIDWRTSRRAETATSYGRPPTA